MLQTEPEPNEDFKEESGNLSKEKFNKNSKIANSDPTLRSQRNSQKLNPIIEEVKDLLESEGE